MLVEYENDIQSGSVFSIIKVIYSGGVTSEWSTYRKLVPVAR